MCVCGCTLSVDLTLLMLVSRLTRISSMLFLLIPLSSNQGWQREGAPRRASAPSLFLLFLQSHICVFCACTLYKAHGLTGGDA